MDARPCFIDLGYTERKGRAQSPCFECIVTAAARVSLPLCCCSTSRGVVALVEMASCDLFEREGSKIYREKKGRKRARTRKIEDIVLWAGACSITSVGMVRGA